MTSRREFLRFLGIGTVAVLAAPAIVRASSLMPIKSATPIDIWYRTQYDLPSWFEGYEAVEAGPIRIVERFTEPGFQSWLTKIDRYPGRTAARKSASDAALDEAIARVLKERVA